MRTVRDLPSKSARLAGSAEQSDADYEVHGSGGGSEDAVEITSVREAQNSISDKRTEGQNEARTRA